MDEHEWPAQRFEEHRTHLRAVAYRMLGSLSMSRAVGCQGSVTVRIERRRSTLLTRTVALRPDCTYSSRSSGNRNGNLEFTARFLGNAALNPRSSITRTVRAG